MTRLLIASLALTVCVASVTAQPGRPASRLGWHTSYEAAKAEAKRTGRPIFLVFRCEP